MEFLVAQAWKQACPGAAVGLLAMSQIRNEAANSALEERSQALAAELQRRYAGWDRAALRATPILAAYHAYYRRFEKTYHVLLQLESVALKGQPIGGTGSLVRAMLMAELDTLLLTAGHDRKKLRGPAGIHLATGDERYTRLGGQEQALKKGDMFIADTLGVLSSILYGPDDRSRIAADTHEVLYTVYAVPGISPERLLAHLAGLEALVRLASPQAVTDSIRVETAA